MAEAENRGLLKLLGTCKNEGDRFVGDEITTSPLGGKSDFEAAISQAFDKQKLFYTSADGFFYKYQQFWWSMGFTLVKYCSQIGFLLGLLIMFGRNISCAILTSTILIFCFYHYLIE